MTFSQVYNPPVHGENRRRRARNGRCDSIPGAARPRPQSPVSRHCSSRRDIRVAKLEDTPLLVDRLMAARFPRAAEENLRERWTSGVPRRVPPPRVGINVCEELISSFGHRQIVCRIVSRIKRKLQIPLLDLERASAREPELQQSNPAVLIGPSARAYDVVHALHTLNNGAGAMCVKF